MSPGGHPNGAMPFFGAAPLPTPDEHIAGWVRRLARANGMQRLSDVDAVIGIDNLRQTSSPKDWQAVATATGLPLRALSMFRHPSSSYRNRNPVEYGGLVVRQSQITLSRLRHCPNCLADDEIIPARWFVHLVTACDKHGILLRDTCAGCDRELRFSSLDAHWRCIQCGHDARDVPLTPATPAELEWIRALPRRSTTQPSDPTMDELSAEAALSVVERLGQTVALARDDEPLTSVGNLNDGGRIVEATDRTVAESRQLLLDAFAILDDWPHAYHRLLDDLLDRAPVDTRQQTALRRMATRAGHMALRPVHLADGTVVAPIAEAQLDWTAKTYPSGSAPSNVRGQHHHLRDVDDYAISKRVVNERAGDRIEHMPVTYAIAMLGGTKGEELAAWIRTELIEVHRDADGGHFVPAESVRRAVRLLSTLPPDGGREGLVEYDAIARTLKRSYSREDLLLDIANGHVGAFVRHRDRTGLNSLAFDTASIDHRRAVVRLAKLAFDDEFRTLGKTRDSFREALGNAGTPTPSQIAAAVDAGLVRAHRSPSRTTPYSIRDLIVLMQSRRHANHIYMAGPLLAGRIRDARDLIVETPRFHGIPELTAIDSRWTRN